MTRWCVQHREKIKSDIIDSLPPIFLNLILPLLSIIILDTVIDRTDRNTFTETYTKKVLLELKSFQTGGVYMDIFIKIVLKIGK